MSLVPWSAFDLDSEEVTVPTETRILVFSPDEVAEALAEYRDAGNGRLPAGDIVHCRVGEDAPDITIKVMTPASREVLTATVAAEAVGAALVAFCLSRKVPLPMKSTRSLEAQGSDLALRISRNRGARALPDFVVSRPNGRPRPAA
jgi:hypothetical protein